MTALAPGPPTPLAQLRARGRVRGGLPLLGPAFVAGIAYLDPGNFATNAAAGSSTGYSLLWVVVVANLVAVLVQCLSAKVGLATGQDLAQLCRVHFPRTAVRGLWLQAELVAMATDLAEVTGGAIALQLLVGLPLLVGGVLTGVVALGLLAMQRRGYRRFELVVGALFAVIVLGVLAELLLVHVDAGAAAAGLVPQLAGPDSALLATGVLGATVMPHAVYLHSSLTRDRVPAAGIAERRHLLHSQRVDVGIAMGVAGLANAGMLVVAAAVFAGAGGGPADSLPALHDGLGAALGPLAANAFAVALLASGFASAGVGTLSGQVVMQGFAGRSVPLMLRRGLTLVPALLALALGTDPTRALVLSQVVLSFGLPFVLVPLVMLTRRRDVMAELVNRPVTTALASAATAGVVAANAVLLVSLLG